MTNAYINPLDLQTIFVSTFSGSWTIFVFLSVFFLSMLAGIFKMPDKIFGILLVLYIIIMANYMGGIYLLAMIVVAFITFYGFARIVKQ